LPVVGAALRGRRARWALTIGLAAALTSFGLALASADGPPARTPRRAAAPADTAAPRRPVEGRIPAALLAGLNPLVHRVERDEGGHARVLASLEGDRTAVLTLDPGLQAHVERELRAYEVPYAALVALDPRDGRVLAYVSHSSANPDAGDLALDPTPPAASVFKVVTGAALVDAGQGADTRVCYGGGASRLIAADLEDSPGRDRQCATLSDAMGGSINAVFAKLADRHLSPPVLERYAAAFGFGQALPFDVPTRPSPAEVPTDRLEFARTAAGFWHMHMSPLHGALVAATIAAGGRMPRPRLVAEVLDARGQVLARSRPETFREVIGEGTARAVGRMMQRTVQDGTASRTFRDPHGVPFIPGVAIAGKTGTLSGSSPYRGYTWWVGYAPADRPTIALAAVVVNTPLWRIKASYVAREALRHHLVVAPAERARAERRSPVPPGATAGGAAMPPVPPGATTGSAAAHPAPVARGQATAAP
jgi:membrane peptidoglycan carboxypeptidase